MLIGKGPNEMSEENKVEPTIEKHTELTKELYLKYKDDDLTDKQIRDKLGMDHNKLHALKKKWNLIGKFYPNSKTKTITNSPPEKTEKQLVVNQVKQDDSLKFENEKLKIVVDALRQEKLKMLDTVSNLERERDMYKQRVDELLKYKFKYGATKEALKVHLE